MPRNRGPDYRKRVEKRRVLQKGEVLAIQFIRFARGQRTWGLIILATERLDYVQLSGGR